MTDIVIDLLTTETVVVEVPAQQGPPGPPGVVGSDDPTNYELIFNIALL